MISNKPDQEAFVWIWLPNETRPVIAGKLEVDNGNILFNYGKSYLERINDSNLGRKQIKAQAMPIDEPELPIKARALLFFKPYPVVFVTLRPMRGRRRVIINKKPGLKAARI